MRASSISVPLALAALALPLAFAAPPILDAWQGHAASHVFYANHRTVCFDHGDARLIVEREMESATFTVVVDAACVPTLTWRGTLTSHGWRFEDPTGTTDGGFFPTGDPGVWHLDGRATNCPPGFICEFTSGIRIHGTFGSATTA